MSITRYKPSEMAAAILALDQSEMRLQDIQVVKLPDKTIYAVNDTFDPTGIFVEGTYNNLLLKDVTKNVQYSPTSLNSIDIDNVLVTYTEKNISKRSNIPVSVYQFPKIVSWTNGTDNEISAMINAADNGLIDLTDYWNVGDERVVHLSSMSGISSETYSERDVVLVLMAADNKEKSLENSCWNYKYVNQNLVRKWPSFIVGMKTLSIKGVMNTTNGCTWDTCARREWCNNIYYNALPNSLVNIFKQVKVKSMLTRNGDQLTESNDYFFLPTIKEIKGGTASSSGTNTYQSNILEFNSLSRWSYYQDMKEPSDIIFSRSVVYYTNGFSIGGYSSSGVTDSTYAEWITPAGCI